MRAAEAIGYTARACTYTRRYRKTRQPLEAAPAATSPRLLQRLISGLTCARICGPFARARADLMKHTSNTQLAPTLICVVSVVVGVGVRVVVRIGVGAVVRVGVVIIRIAAVCMSARVRVRVGVPVRV